MITIRIHHATIEEQAAMRDTLCNALKGWAPFINSEVAVCDTTADDPEPITRLIIGNEPPVKGENVLTFDVKASDIYEYLGEYIAEDENIIPTMYANPELVEALDASKAEDNDKYQFIPEKRVIMPVGSTAKDWIKELEKLPEDTNISICGAYTGYIHVAKAGVTLDCEPLYESYPEGAFEDEEDDDMKICDE